MARILTYEEKDTWIHRLSGITKLVFSCFGPLWVC